MSRTGAEPRPPWQAVPLAIRRQVETLLGAPVVRAERVWGGYAPSPTFRLRLAGGRRVFLKGADQNDPNPQIYRTLERETRIYRELRHLIEPWAPAYYGDLRDGAWRVLLLEELGAASVPPWTAAKARVAALEHAAMHRQTWNANFPRWLPRARQWGPVTSRWNTVLDSAGELGGTASVAGARAGEAQQWLVRHGPALQRAAHRLSQARPPYALLHLDLRSDNIRFQGQRLRAFDWPYACAGPPEIDVAAFAQSVACEGGPSPEQFLAWYESGWVLRPALLDAAVAAIAGFFAYHAWRPDIPRLPRLRSIQRRQLRASLAWAARRSGLPEPAWLEAVPA